MNETAQREEDVAIGDAHTPINPYVMTEINNLHRRITTQNKTMEAIWNRLHPLTKFHDWVRETHPELADQYASIRELEEVSKTDRSVATEMGRGYGAAQVKAAGQPVKYGVGNGNL